MKKTLFVGVLALILAGVGCSAPEDFYRQGLEHINSNPTKAAELFEYACADECTDGCYQLGLMLRKGKGIAKDTKRATSILQKACDSGSKASCKALKPKG